MTEDHQLPYSLTLPAPGQALLLTDRLRWLPGKRGTYRGSYGDRPALIKLYPRTDSQARRNYFRELTGVRLLRDRAIATPDLLYHGQTQQGDYCVVTEYLADATDLQKLLTTALSAGAAQPPTAAAKGRALGAVIASLHNAGLIQKDVHLGNFLYHQQRILVVDGSGIAPIRLFGNRCRINNLALLLAQLPVTAAVLAAELIRGYGGEPSLAQMAMSLQRQRLKRERRYLQKTLRSCSEFRVTRRWSHRQIIRTDQLDAEDLQTVLANLDKAMAEGVPLKQGNSSTLVKIRPQQRWLVIKRYNIKSPWHRLRRMLRPTRAVCSWQNGYRLAMWGLATPLPLALGELRQGPLRGQAYLISEYSELPSCSDWRAQHLASAESAQLIAALTAMVAGLQELGLVHGDLKADNLKFDGDQMQLMDLDSLSRYKGRRLLSAIQADCQRLLKNWQSEPNFSSDLSASLAERLRGHTGNLGAIVHTGFIQS